MHRGSDPIRTKCCTIVPLGNSLRGYGPAIDRALFYYLLRNCQCTVESS